MREEIVKLQAAIWELAYYITDDLEENGRGNEADKLRANLRELLAND